MILRLRQRHRRMFLVLGVLLPIGFVAGIAARRPIPAIASLPPELMREGAQSFTATNWTRGDLFAKAPVKVRLLRERSGVGKFALSFSAAGDFLKPDLIVYWTNNEAKIGDTVPENARLLGTFSSPALPLPEETAGSSGVLILYSLANNEIVDVSRPIQLSGSAR